MATKPAPAVSAADVIGSFARNQQRRERNLDKIVFATDKTLEGKKIEDLKSHQPVSFGVIYNEFNSLSEKTAAVQQAITSGAVISPSLANAHVSLQARIASLADNVTNAAVQTGVVQAEKSASTSRLPSAKTVAKVTVGTAVLAAAGTAGYLKREAISEAALNTWAKAPTRDQIVQFATDQYSKVKDLFSSAGSYPGVVDTFNNFSTPAKIAVGAGSAAVVLGAVVYRKQIGNGISAVARVVASPFKAGFNGLKNKFKSARSDTVASTAALPAAPVAVVVK